MADIENSPAPLLFLVQITKKHRIFVKIGKIYIKKYPYNIEYRDIMVVHKCPHCHQKFNQKCHLRDHLNKKKKCYLQKDKEYIDLTENNIPKPDANIPNLYPKNGMLEFVNENQNNCPYCHNEYSTKCSLNRHIKYNCKVIKIQEKEKQNIFQDLLKKFEDKHNDQMKELQEQNQKLTEMVIKLADNTINNKNDPETKLKTNTKPTPQNINNTEDNSTTNNNNSNNTFNQQQNNIVMVGYGKEDLDRLSKEEILKVLGKGYSAVIQLTDDMHFGSKYPEYHNVYIPSMKEKYGMIYNGKSWDLINKDELVDNIYYDKKDMIDDKFEAFYDSLSKPKQEALERWFEDDNNDDTKQIDKIKDKIKLLLYNKRHIPMEARRLTNK